MKITISLAQLEFQFSDIEVNFQHVENRIKEAAILGSDLILIPELWDSGYDLENWAKYASPLGEGSFKRVSSLAVKYHISIGCSMIEEKDGHAFNTFVLYGHDGETWGVYRKIHRFRLLQEEKWLEAGDRLVLAQTPWGKVGLSICYDLRFPELFRKMSDMGAQIIALPSAFTAITGRAHWEVLLRARAIENLCYVIASAQGGYHVNGRETYGDSMIVNPWGSIMDRLASGSGYVIANIDLDYLASTRRNFPVLNHRKMQCSGV